MQHCIKSSKRIVPFPNRSNFRIKMLIRLSDNRYPNAVSAVRSSFLSMLPDPSESNDRKQFCQSVTYFQRAPKSWKLTVPRFSLSNIPVIWLKIWVNQATNTATIKVFGVEKLLENIRNSTRTQNGLKLLFNWFLFSDFPFFWFFFFYSFYRVNRLKTLCVGCRVSLSFEFSGTGSQR